MIKPPEQRQWRRSGIFIVNFDFTHCSSVSIVDIKQVNDGWEINGEFYNKDYNNV